MGHNRQPTNYLSRLHKSKYLATKINKLYKLVKKNTQHPKMYTIRLWFKDPKICCVVLNVILHT